MVMTQSTMTASIPRAGPIPGFGGPVSYRISGKTTGSGSGNRTHTFVAEEQILSLLCIPVSPSRHDCYSNRPLLCNGNCRRRISPHSAPKFMHFSSSTDVFVIGGGPAGLATAIAARRKGFDVTLADCAVPPIDKACGEGVMPDGQLAASTIGINLDEIPGARFSGIRFEDSETVLQSRFPRGHGLGMRRTTLHNYLVDVAAEAGVRMHWGTPITGIGRNSVTAGGQQITTRWIVGADGGQSRVRRWAGLDAASVDTRRYGFRAHYRIEPWSEFMQVYWGDGCQIYVTPVAGDEICVAVLSRDHHLRLADALPRFPQLAQRISHVEAARPASEMGGMSVTRRFHSVHRGDVALVGDSSGSIDAITGEGMCLLFQQSGALADAVAAGNLELYQKAHDRIGRRPRFMSDVMLMLAEHPHLRSRAFRLMASHPRLFEGMLKAHVGEASPATSISSGLALGWYWLTL